MFWENIGVSRTGEKNIWGFFSLEKLEFRRLAVNV